ncbi:MAG: signal peptidase I [Enterococcus faecalis]|nr:signal peptidase I [Enterococcus faecalis]
MSSLLKRLVQLVLLVVAVLLIRHYVFSPAAVNGSSMEPTLHNNDRLWVTSIKKPQRFDIIAFPSPRNGQRVAKRLIGLPGETVEYRDDTLYINGVSLSEDYLASAKRNVSKIPKILP